MMTLRGWLVKNPVLAWTAAFQVALAILALITMPFDQRTILGINPWIKPLKFDVSVGIMLVTLAAILSGLQGFDRSRLWIGAGVGISLSIENCIISMQSQRGVRSHMNYSTPLNAHLFELMAVFIVISTVLFAWTLALVVLDPTRWPPAVAWGVRLGLLTLLAGSLEGVVMVVHGGHTVGANDGLSGLPVVNWSRDHGEPFEVSSLGATWEETVTRWPEGARASFVAEMMQRSPAPAEVVALAMKDPSPAVRKSLLSFVWWGMSLEEISRFSQTLDDANFKELIAGMHPSELPPSMHPRALEIYVAAANDATGPLARFLAWREAASFGHESFVDELKVSLSQLEANQVRDLESRDLQGRELRATIEMMRRTDSQWVTAWVVQNLLAGALRPDGWIDLVDGLTSAQRDEFVGQVTNNEITDMRVPGVIPLLRKFADREIVQRLFRRICELVPIIATSKPGDDKQAEAKLARQLEDLLRGMPPNPTVNGILQEIGGRTEAVEIEVVTEIFHTAGRDNTPLREGLSAEIREALRNYLNTAMPTVNAPGTRSERDASN
jgi:hypothetical protein